MGFTFEQGKFSQRRQYRKNAKIAPCENFHVNSTITVYIGGAHFLLRSSYTFVFFSQNLFLFLMQLLIDTLSEFFLIYSRIKKINSSLHITNSVLIRLKYFTIIIPIQRTTNIFQMLRELGNYHPQD